MRKLLASRHLHTPRLVPLGITVAVLLVAGVASAWSASRDVTPARDALGSVSIEASGLSRERIDGLLEEATRQDTDALLVLADGRVVVEEYFGAPPTPITIMSATKSIVSLAIGLLLDEGRIETIDEPVATILTEWQPDPLKSTITLRHMLSHTSGLDSARGDVNGDVVTHALASHMKSTPGAVFVYNNNVADLLAEVVRRASGEPIDVYLEQRLFRPLEFEDWRWRRDGAGTPLAAGELTLRPIDLAKLGQLVLQKGEWKGRQVVSTAWINEALEPTVLQDRGLYWWRSTPLMLTDEVLAEMTSAGLPQRAAAAMRPLVGRRFESTRSYLRAVSRDLDRR